MLGFVQLPGRHRKRQTAGGRTPRGFWCTAACAIILCCLNSQLLSAKERSEGELTCFEIDEKLWKGGLKVYLLDGGMSAEYVVQKAAEALNQGIAHTWHVSAPASGPNPVYAAPAFLQNSIQATVDFYDQVLGVDTPFDTVIISTGIPSAPYLSATMKAPVLPLHYLVSFDSIDEVKGVLEQASRDGMSAYATAGQDPSVEPGVAWIKILDLPKLYAEFLKRHRVSNVLLIGSTATSGGETLARRLSSGIARREEYSPESIYIMYTGSESGDATALREKIKDFGQLELEDEFIGISDWESGIVEPQITNFARSIKELTSTKSVWSVTAEDLIGLYNLGTYSAAAFLKANADKRDLPGPQVRGVCLNPYLISHPWYELHEGFVPLLYWQGNPPTSTVGRLRSVAFAAVEHFFPTAKPNELVLHLNSSRNCGGEHFANALESCLVNKQLTRIRKNGYSCDEVWSPEDGMNAPCEVIARRLIESESLPRLRNLHSRQVSLTPKDLYEISQQFPEFSVERR